MIITAQKKPIKIKAIQLTKENTEEVLRFMGVEDRYAAPVLTSSIVIRTLEGDMTASDGDYIIQGVGGEFYPCKPDIFEKSYDIIPE